MYLIIYVFNGTVFYYMGLTKPSRTSDSR